VRRAIIFAAVVALPCGRAAGQDRPNLKALSAQQRVIAVSYCRGAYDVTLADGSVRRFNEYDLALKIDSSPNGPAAATPALVPTGRVGDRAFVVFATPEELSAAVKPVCRD